MSVQPATAAVVHVNKTHPLPGPIIRRWIDGSWPLRGSDPVAWASYLEPVTTLIAVAYRISPGRRALTIIDVREVTGYSITGHRADFSTVPAPALEYLIGEPSPVGWRRGDGWPIKLIELAPRPAPATCSAA